MIIIETTVWIDYFADRSNRWTEWLDRKIGVEAVGLTDLIFCEVLQGYKDERTFEEIRRKLTKLEIFPTGGRDIALESARNYRSLRARGLTVRKTVDCIIATYCIAEGYALLHHDRDYDAFEKHLGLKVIHP